MLRKTTALACACLLASLPAGVWAHPLDISATTATVKKSGVDFVTYLHSYEAELVMGRAGVRVEWSDVYVENARVIADYVLARVKIRTGDRECALRTPEVPKQPMYEILSKWLEVRYSALCELSSADPVAFRIDLFPDLPLQTNRLAVYDARSGDPLATGNTSYVLTPNIPERVYEAGAPAEPKADSDRDGLPDEEERIYRTDPSDPDTDGDYYSDYEEATLGWNPINAELGPGQSERNGYVSFDLSKVLFASGAVASPNADAKYGERYVRATNLLDSSGWGQEYLVGTLKALDGAVNDFSLSKISWALMGVALLGFLHALGPGHAKTLLAALVADRRRTYLESVLFAGIFTVTHLLDIVLLFAVTRGIFAIADPTAYMAYLQMGATALLAGVGLWLVIGALRRIRSCAGDRSATESEAPASVRVGFLTGIIAGIAPCTFGWSLFLLLFSLGRLDLVPLILLAFGLGIFACLWCVATGLHLARERAYRGLDAFARWSPLASGLVVLGIAGWLASGYLG